MAKNSFLAKQGVDVFIVVVILQLAYCYYILL